MYFVRFKKKSNTNKIATASLRFIAMTWSLYLYIYQYLLDKGKELVIPVRTIDFSYHLSWSDLGHS